ncbi:hypothetical protein I4641_05615 [Waterburya agarophytonicola K14]|uniref:Protein kinase domain-containing protein n=1 Tax=Waterburya agarophytonicola KI4 TaxID=2874699 RepID=A0A964FEB7_9CYAN|nr:hypothetical protein [Waterburya agarophytonicola]MCC0176455.1 hypothetical protein [Waterburya agarophytonicola KI4]
MNNKRWLNLIYSFQLAWILRVLSLFLGGKLNAKLEQKLQQCQRIIEIAATQVRFADCCRDRNANNYLGLLTKDPLDEERSQQYILLTDRYFSLKRNNADLLILSEKEELERIWFFDEYKHARYVFFAPINPIALLVGLPGLFKNTIFRRIQPAGVITLEDNLGIKQPVLAIAILKRVTPNARRFVSPLLGVSSFFQALNQQQVSYAILRWFEDLPLIMPGEDIDMLVADRDIETVESLLQQQPGIIPCDLYTVSGLPGTAYKNMAYYPPLLAEQILAGTIILKETFAVPNPELHFYSLAYHAIYHKGQKSGIPLTPQSTQKSSVDPEHQYRDILQNLAHALNLEEVELTLQGLDRLLNSVNWRPSEDTLARLDSRDIWLQERSQKNAELKPKVDITGLAVFFIRQKALDLNLESEIIELLEREGFNLIKIKVLGSKKAQRVKYQIRGGNWGKGPWAESGGDPAMVIVALDLMPTAPTAEQLAKQPHLSNGRIRVKNKIRDAVNRSLEIDQRCNTVHSSDNEREAWNYLEITFPRKLEKMQRKIDRLRQNFETNYAVKEVLTRFGRRAKVEVIEYGDRLAVQKTFRPGCEKFWQREIFASQAFAKDCLAIPPLLDYGENYLVHPYYDDILKFRNRQSKLLPLAIAKQAMATLRFFYEQGYAPIDFQPANIIVDRSSGLKILDFEFLYQYDCKPESFEQCYELAGIPDDFPGDKPNFRLEMSYDARWKPYIGLSLDSLLRDPLWLQQIKRFVFAMIHLPWRIIKNRWEMMSSQNNFELNSLLTLIKQKITKIKLSTYSN